jgi:hypothetical protein
MLRSQARAALALATLLVTSLAGQAWAQGEDGTPAERDLLVIAELLPGDYDNYDQPSFERRLGVPEDEHHDRRHWTITRQSLSAFGEHVFLVEEHGGEGGDELRRRSIYALAADNAAGAVRMRTYELEGDAAPDLESLDPAGLSQGCDVLWRRQAAQFHGATEDSCRADRPDGAKAHLDLQLFLGEAALWVRHRSFDEAGTLLEGNKAGIFHTLDRARAFECYADIPGVAGGRDEPYHRYEDLFVHDQGGQVWFETKEQPARTLGILLNNVDGPINNQKGIFTRDSLVMYVMEKQGEESRTHTYAWTEPRAERIGVNMRWMLVNCFMESNEVARPEM